MHDFSGRSDNVLLTSLKSVDSLHSRQYLLLDEADEKLGAIIRAGKTNDVDEDLALNLLELGTPVADGRLAKNPPKGLKSWLIKLTKSHDELNDLVTSLSPKLDVIRNDNLRQGLSHVDYVFLKQITALDLVV